MKRLLDFLRAGAGTVASQLAALLLLPLLFRAYDPAAFGTWTTIAAIVIAVGTTATLRYELAIVIEPADDDAATLFWTCLGIGLLTATLAGAIIYFIASQLGNPLTADFSVMALCAVWLGAMVGNQPVQCWLLRSGKFGANSICLATATIGSNVAQLALVQVLPGFSGLVAGSALGTLVGAICGVALVARQPPPMIGGVATVRTLLARNRRFPIYSLPFTLLSLARERAPILALALFAPAAQVGAYSQAWRLISLPAGLTSSALRPVVFHAAARDGIAMVQPLIATLLAVIAVMGAPWLGVIAAQPQWTFGALLGPAWQIAGSYAAILAVPALLFAMSNWLDRVFDAAQRSDLNLKLEILAVVLSLGGFAGALLMGWPLIWVIVLQSVGLVTSYLFVIATCIRLGASSLAPLFKVLAIGASAASFTGTLVVVGAALAGPRVGFGIGVATALAIDVAAVVVFRRRGTGMIARVG